MGQSQSQTDRESQGHGPVSIMNEKNRAPFMIVFGNSNTKVDREVFFQLKKEEQQVYITSNTHSFSILPLILCLHPIDNV